jgi:hypothetical protein
MSGWVVNATPRRLYPQERPGTHFIENGWAPGPVWTGTENLDPTGILSPDHPFRSESLYRPRYPTHIKGVVVIKMISDLLFSRKAVQLLTQPKTARFSDLFQLSEGIPVTTLPKVYYVVSKCYFTERKVIKRHLRLWI